MVSEFGTAVQTEYYLRIFASRKYNITQTCNSSNQMPVQYGSRSALLFSSVAFNDEFHMCGSFWIISIRFAELKIKLDIFSVYAYRNWRKTMTSMTYCIDAPWLVDGRKSCRVVSVPNHITATRHDLSRTCLGHGRPSRHVRMVNFPVTSPLENEIPRFMSPRGSRGEVDHLDMSRWSAVST